MERPRACILKADGTNCDNETRAAFELAGADAKIVLLNDLIAGEDSLKNYQMLGLPGGFSFGDDVRAGIILASKLNIYLADEIDDFITKGGSAIGICNGYQELVSMGLLPGGQANSSIEVALANNAVGHFVCDWKKVRVENSLTPFFEGLPRVIDLQVAHGEGRFMAGIDVFDEIRDFKLVPIRYCDRLGRLTQKYPDNPNGSMNAIAGICDPSGRILGMMPHPERFVRLQQHPNWRRQDGPEFAHGLKIFQNMVDYAKQS